MIVCSVSCRCVASEEICRRHGADRALRALRGDPEPEDETQRASKDFKEVKEDNKNVINVKEEDLKEENFQSNVQGQSPLESLAAPGSGPAWFGNAVDPESE